MHIYFSLTSSYLPATLSLLFFQNFYAFLIPYLLYMILLSRGNSKKFLHLLKFPHSKTISDRPSTNTPLFSSFLL